MKKMILRQAGDGYEKHRIPGMIRTSGGRLIVYGEDRKSAGDWSEMDILAQFSDDGGETFSPPYALACGKKSRENANNSFQNTYLSAFGTVNNPVMVEDSRGRIHLLFCENYSVGGGKILHRISEDGGRSFGEVEDISACCAPEYHNAFAFGPGHGIRTAAGDLLIPVWMVPKSYGSPEHAHAPSVISTLVSRDDGEHFRLGEIFPLYSEGLFSPNETAIAELADGKIYLNCRIGGGFCYRGRAYSETGCSGWYDYSPDTSLPDPACFGSCFFYTSEKIPGALLFANCASQTGRKNVTLRASFDGGRSFPISRLIDEEHGGYVELCADSDRREIYLLYEENFGERLHFVTLSEDDIFGE